MREIKITEDFFNHVELVEGLTAKCHITQDRIIDSLYRVSSVEEDEGGALKITTTIYLGRDHDVHIPVICSAERRGKFINIVDITAIE